MSVIPSTGPVYPDDPTTIHALRARLETVESRLLQLERNRPGSPLVTTATRNGHAPAWNVGSLPILGELTFHMVGALAVATSPANHSRWHANVVALSIDINDYAGGTITFHLKVGGVDIAGSPFTLTTANVVGSAPGTAWLPVTPPYPVNAYTDPVVADWTAVDASSDMVIHAELG